MGKLSCWKERAIRSRIRSVSAMSRKSSERVMQALFSTLVSRWDAILFFAPSLPGFLNLFGNRSKDV